MDGHLPFTNKSLPVLKQQTNLEELDIRGTSISFAGMLTLRNLKLSKLRFAVRRYLPSEIDELKKAFPKTEFDYRGTGIGSDKEVLYAPLK